MNTTTFILLIKVDKVNDPRKILESCEGQTLINVKANETAIKKYLVETINTPYIDTSLSVWSLSDYMDAFNNTDDDRCELDISDYFMGYIHV